MTLLTRGRMGVVLSSAGEALLPHLKGSVQCGPGAPGGGGPTPRTHPGHHSGGDIQQYFGPLAAPGS